MQRRKFQLVDERNVLLRQKQVQIIFFAPMQDQNLSSRKLKIPTKPLDFEIPHNPHIDGPSRRGKQSIL